MFNGASRVSAGLDGTRLTMYSACPTASRTVRKCSLDEGVRSWSSRRDVRLISRGTFALRGGRELDVIGN